MLEGKDPRTGENRQTKRRKIIADNDIGLFKEKNPDLEQIIMETMTPKTWQYYIKNQTSDKESPVL